MKKQRALLAQLLKSLGIDQENQDLILNGMFPENETTDPTLDQDTILAAAQEYSKPFLKEHFERELQPGFKGKYLNDAIGKIVQASGGVLKRADVDGKSLEDVAKMYAEKVRGGATATQQEQQNMIDELNRQLEAKDQEWTGKLDAVKTEYSAKEQRQNLRERTIALLGKKTISVTPGAAVDPLLFRLESKGLEARWNDQKQDFDVYKKGTEELAKKPGGTAFFTYDELLSEGLKEYNWEQKSQGGGSGSGQGQQGQQGGQQGQQFRNGQQGQQGQQGGQQGQPALKRSPLGERMEKALAEHGGDDVAGAAGVVQ